MIISVASGKGGTGKTTVATNLALSIGKAQFIDCDVEEPNANIFLKTKIKEHEDVSVSIPEMDKEKCDYCGKCSEFCVYNALAVVPSDVLVFPELCHSCGGCELVCPKDAVSWNKRVIGRIEHGQAGDIDFYHGLLNVGEMQAVPVIKALKRKVDKSKHVIIDVSPGTSCPVIESISGSDYCILVTEPTPFGEHDLKRIFELIEILNQKADVIINRSTLTDYIQPIYNMVDKYKCEVLGEIPLDNKVIENYAKGIPFIFDSQEFPAKQAFLKIFERISQKIKTVE